MVRDILLSLVVSLGYFCVIFVLFLLHWRYELPCQDKLPEIHCTPILDCIRVLWLVFQPLGLELDKALCGWNSVTLVSNDGSEPIKFLIHAHVMVLGIF